MLNSLFSSAPDATLLVDLSGNIIRVNRQAEILFGYDRNELVGTAIDRLLPEQFQIKGADDYTWNQQEMAARSMGSGLELSALQKDGEKFPADMTLSPVSTEEGKLVICAIRNMTEQKRLQSELAETHRRLFESIEAERLLIAQELHDGPIQDLYGTALYLETLKDVLQIPAETEDLGLAKENVHNIIQALRSVCGELRPPTLTHFGLEKAIRSHLIKVREAHPEIEIEAHLINDGSTLSERARLALYRVYQNAVSNSIRHAQASHIWIEFRMEDGEIQFTVQDDGRGFAVPHRWVDLVREGHFGLVGMIERVEALGGNLTVDSAVGQGTWIRVRVPLERPVISDIAAVT